MTLELAPLEGITTYIYRNAYARHFGDIDKYYTPFLSLHKEKEFNHKERQEILPENNQGIHVIPQVLTNSSEDFLRAAEKIKALGYEEINVNFGCPSGTVTTKAKGAGMLAEPERLDRFLEEIFEKAPMKISVKTRLGMEQPEEWERLLEIYNKYPLAELIIHARVRQDFYKNAPNWEAFGKAVAQSKNPICYNGDIFSVEDYERLINTFPTLKAVMLGRGIIVNPGLAGKIRKSPVGSCKGSSVADNSCGGSSCKGSSVAGRSRADSPHINWDINGDRREGKVDAEYFARLREFHNEIYTGYRGILSGDRDVLFKMKELWTYMVHSFPDAEKHGKKLRKVKDCGEYESYVRSMFRQAHIIPITEEPERYRLAEFVQSPFVEVTSQNGIDVKMQYPLLGMQHAEKRCLMRKEVYERLVEAQKLLPEGFHIRVWDAWRPFALQEELYRVYAKDIMETFSLQGLSREEQEKEIAKYISPPIPDRECPPTHATGGAVDVTLIDASGRELDMGTGFDSFSPKTQTAFYEKRNNEADDENRHDENEDNKIIKQNRRILYHAMTGAGFTNLPSEWWHYDYGDRLWAYYTKRPAIYKGVFDITEIYEL